MFPAGTRVLVVDDVMTMRRMIIDILKQGGLTDFVEAEDGAEGWHELKSARKAGKPFGLAIVDWQMPHMSGVDLLRKVRASPDDARLPFIMLTSVADKEHIIEAAKAGVSEYLMKPVRIEVLLEKLKAVYTRTAFADSIIIE